MGGSSAESSESDYYVDESGKMKKREKKKRGLFRLFLSADLELSRFQKDLFRHKAKSPFTKTSSTRTVSFCFSFFWLLLIEVVAGTVVRKKIRIPKDKKKKQRVYNDDELDEESEYESIDSAKADKLVARQICELSSLLSTDLLVLVSQTTKTEK